MAKAESSRVARLTFLGTFVAGLLQLLAGAATNVVTGVVPEEWTESNLGWLLVGTGALFLLAAGVTGWAARGSAPDPDQASPAAGSPNERGEVHTKNKVRAREVHGSIFQAGVVQGDINFHTSPSTRPTVGAPPPPPDGAVDRPGLRDDVVKALLSEDNQGPVALIGVTGAGGFGKSTLAALVANDPRVEERFRDGTLWVTLGAHVGKAELAEKINDLAARVAGERPSYTDPEQAGSHLAEVLRDKHCLLVIDDVWRRSQLEPFLVGAPSCRRLVTTRMPKELPVGAATVEVEAMTAEQAIAVLSRGLESTEGVDWRPLLARTGRWPVLLSLVNRQVHDQVSRGLPAVEAARQVADLLATNGPATLDEDDLDQLSEVDVNDPERRKEAVAATVESSLSLLAEKDHRRLERFLELAVFAEDSTIYEQTLRTYWGHTAGLDEHEVRKLCTRLADLSLVQGYRLDEGQPRLWLHDVMRDYIRHRTGTDLPTLHRALLNAYREHLPTADGVTAWWELPDTEPYMWHALSRHLHEVASATGDAELNAVICDFRWITAVLRKEGPAAVERDLECTSHPLTPVLQRVIRQNAHLLGALEPHNALPATLLSRMYSSPSWPTTALLPRGPFLRPTSHLGTHSPTLPTQHCNALSAMTGV